MIFCGPTEPWEDQYFKKMSDRYIDAIAWEDYSAINMYPEYRKFYDKLWLGNNIAGCPTIDLEKESPGSFPIFIKPRVNLLGMSRKAYIAESPKDILDVKGMIAQQVLKGKHTSTDYLIKDNKIIASKSFEACADKNGSFWLFRHGPYSPLYIDELIENLKLGTRIINVESIGGTIIEVHFRPSVQFFDLSGGMLAQAPKVVLGGKYEPQKQDYGYSRVYRRPSDGIPKLIKKLPKKPNKVSSLQLCWYESLPLSACSQDEKSYRYLTINGTDLTAIEKYGRLINKCIIFE